MTRTIGVVLVVLAASAAGCAGAARRPPPTAKAAPVVVDAGLEASVDAGEPLPSLDVLAARGATEAPLMREIRRVDDAGSRPVEIRAPADRDVCVRAAFAASRPVRAWLEDDAHAPRGDVSPASTSGLVPAKGPACARRGEVLRLVLDAEADAGAVAARAVVWQAP